MDRDLAKVTARLKGVAIVEDITAEVGYSALKLTWGDGKQRVERAHSAADWREKINNVRHNHEMGRCIFLNYDTLL